MKSIYVLTILLPLCAGLVVGQETLDPELHPWCKYAEGSWVKLKIVTEMGPMGVQESEMVQTLKAKSDTEYTTLNKTTAMGQTNEQEATQSMPGKVGEETVEVGGESLDCTIWQQERQEGANDIKSWLNGDGLPLKLEDSSLKAAATEIGVTISVSGEEVECVLLEGTVDQGGMAGTVKMWMSHDVPGGMARMEMELEVPQMGKVKTTMEVAEFEIK